MFRRAVLFMTAFLLLFTSCAVAENTPAADPDYARAFTEGYVDSRWQDADPDTVISSTDFRAMLVSLVTALASDRVPRFEEKVTDFETPLRRGEAVVMAWYAATCIGADGYTDTSYNASADDPDFWNSDGERMEKLFPDIFRQNPVHTEVNTWDNGYIAANLWNQWHSSPYSLQMTFAFDEANKSMHNADPCTVAEAVCAVTRLYDSALNLRYSFDMAEYLLRGGGTDAERALLSAADARRAAILGSTNEIQASGTTYYVSNSGNDKNNGKSPEKAWATLKHAFSRKLKKGDVVLLERGSEWVRPVDNKRGLTSDILLIPEGVTVGAYGEGPKPVIRGDIPDESNDPAFWTLYREQDGVRIWQAARPLREINIIVFNDGAAWADRVYPCFDGKGYCFEDGSPFVPENALVKDNTFCVLPDLKGKPDEIHGRNCAGPLYLRCDVGNPAEVWEKVIVPQCPCGLNLGKNRAAYDLDIRYFTSTAVVMADPDMTGSGTLVNCEVSWCAGSVGEYQSTGSSANTAYCPGCAVQVTGDHTVVKDCYIHDCGPMSMTLSIHQFRPRETEFRVEDVHMTGNLIERSGPVHFADLVPMDVENGHGLLADYLFEDNMVFFAGMGWIKNMIDASERSIIPGLFRSGVDNAMGPVDNEGVVFRNNVFFYADYTLVYLGDQRWGNTGPVNAQPVFEGNTYAQPANLLLLVQMDRHLEFHPGDPEALGALGDPSGTVIIIR